MQRYFVSKENVQPPYIWINGEDTRHIQKVMRMTAGDECLCTVSGETVFRCSIISFENQLVKLEIINTMEQDPELPVHIAIAQGLPKSDKLDWILQKGTETGAAEFIPYQAERSIVKWPANKWEKKADRYRKIVKEAAEQSHRLTLPEIHDVMDLKQLLEYSNTFDYKIIAYEETAKENQQSGLPDQFKKMFAGAKVLIIVGPEGGLSSDEVDTLQENGFSCCGLGPRILRTETAAIYILAAASYHFELLNGVN